MNLVYYDCWKEILCYLDYRSIACLRLAHSFFPSIATKKDLNNKIGILYAIQENLITEKFPIDLDLIDFSRGYKDILVLKPGNPYMLFDDGTVEKNEDYMFYGKNKLYSKYNTTNININSELKFILVIKGKEVEIYIHIRNLFEYRINVYRNKYGIVESFYIFSPAYEEDIDEFYDPEDDYVYEEDYDY